ncbi:DUF551 domain-containing protein [Enterobacter hormaechei]|uniref:DUF551 domain-containing protein n=1 Tax=Enterobacter hormaechei TaxID=158836 RepID=UPI001BD2E1AC|nr:DUF551 domain-containing protein [Enterobacter hormaechei]
MSATLKEWLLKTIAELEEERDSMPGVVNEDAANALAAMKLALASLEAEGKLSNLVASQESLGGDFEKVLAENIEELYVPGISVPPAPVSVPDAMEMDDDFDSAFEHGKAVGWNACRAAMLHGAEPVSQPDELPMDYLQGHKDGLEWAARLAEANHPQTGDWLYDDPLELAKAIRKGPDMPTSPVQGWIPCSERMPQKNERVIIFINFNSETVPPSIHDAQFTGSTFRRGNATVNVFPLEDGYGVTHWMPLPEAPKQEA